MSKSFSNALSNRRASASIGSVELIEVKNSADVDTDKLPNALERSNSLKIDQRLRDEAAKAKRQKRAESGRRSKCCCCCAASTTNRVSRYIRKSLGLPVYDDEASDDATEREKKASYMMGEPVGEVKQVVRQPKLSVML